MSENRKNKELPLTQYAQTAPLVTLEDLRQRYGHRSSDRSIRNLLYRMKRDGRLRALTKGVYTGVFASMPLNRYAVPGKLRRDAVVAFHSALELHGVANQVFQTVYYLSARPRKDLAFDGTTYHSVTPPRRLAGARRLDFQVEETPDHVRVTGRERSILDCLLFLEYSGGVEEVDKCLAMLPSFDFEAAFAYLKLLRRPWLYARLGYLLDRNADKLFFSGTWRDSMLRRLPRGVAYLGPKRSGYRWVPTWNLMVPETLAHTEDGSKQR
jgi:predicted transcriptional regulator of viral defense system